MFRYIRNIETIQTGTELNRLPTRMSHLFIITYNIYTYIRQTYTKSIILFRLYSGPSTVKYNRRDLFSSKIRFRFFTT